MKQFIFLIILVFTSSFLFSQSENSCKRTWHFGFDMGLNYLNFDIDSNYPKDQFHELHDESIQVGFISTYKLSKHFYISPKLEFSFHESYLFIDNVIDPRGTGIMPISLDFMVHFEMVQKVGSVFPFLYAGPNLKIPLMPIYANKHEFNTGHDLALDFGLGVHLNKFTVSFSPNIRYSIGLLDVNEIPALNSIKLQYLFVGLNFMI